MVILKRRIKNSVYDGFGDDVMKARGVIEDAFNNNEDPGYDVEDSVSFASDAN